MSTADDQAWKPKASLETLKLRARIYQSIRDFFAEREVMEVETPSLSHAASTDPQIESFQTVFKTEGLQDGQPLYLITSPEFHMKRLLAAGSGSIYQLCHVFRQAELGSQHNPEFTLLEWYRVDMDYQQLMREVAELVGLLFDGVAFELEFLTYREAFKSAAGIDPLTAPLDELQRRAQEAGLCIPSKGQDDKDLYLDYLMSHCIQPNLGQGRLSFIYEYPASQCALARLSPQNSRVAERFELFLEGRELANGFRELTDAAEQRQRFENEQRHRRALGKHIVQMDQNLLDALESGLPDCSGVALGLDRLIQLMANKKNLNEVLAFPFNHA